MFKLQRPLLNSFFSLVLSVFISSSVRAQNEPVRLEAEEYRFYELLTKVRKKLGLPELGVPHQLQSISINHSVWMAFNQILSHNGPTIEISFAQRFKMGGYNAPWAGENVSCGYKSAVSAFKAFASSKGHLPNMISPHYSEMGISRRGNGTERCPYYWTNDFGGYGNAVDHLPEITDPQKINEAFNSVVGEVFNPTYGKKKSFLSCTIPALLGKNILADGKDFDTLVEVDPAGNGLYDLTVGFYVNGSRGGLSGFAIKNISVIRDLAKRGLTLISPMTERSKGFSIQYDFGSMEAYFYSNGTIPLVEGNIACTLSK